MSINTLCKSETLCLLRGQYTETTQLVLTKIYELCVISQEWRKFNKRNGLSLCFPTYNNLILHSQQILDYVKIEDVSNPSNPTIFPVCIKSFKENPENVTKLLSRMDGLGVFITNTIHYEQEKITKHNIEQEKEITYLYAHNWIGLIDALEKIKIQ